MLPLVAAVAVPALVACLLLVVALRCARGRRVAATTFSALLSLAFILAAMVVAFAGAGLISWSRLTHETHAADLAFKSAGPKAFDVDVAYADGRHETYRLEGDEWQIDARVLKWRAFANVIGFDTAYRLERLAGRYADIDTERAATHTVYRLHDDDRLDVWGLVRVAQSHLPWIDARYGSAVYLPMADGARYAVSVAQSGLLARPLNDAARSAVSGWH